MAQRRAADAADERPAGFAAESRAVCELTEVEPGRRLRFTWPGVGDVTFTLAAAGAGTLLTIVHRRVPDRGAALMVGAGWHAHADVLAARLAERPAPSFWAGWQRLRGEYDQRLPR